MKLKKLVCGMMALAISGATVYAAPGDYTKPAQPPTGQEVPGFRPVQPVKPGIPVKPETLPAGVKLTKDQATAMVLPYMPKASTHVETKLVDGKGKYHYEVTYTYKMMELVSIVDANAGQLVKISAEDTTFVGMKVKNLFHKNPNYTPVVTVKEAEMQAVSLLKDSKVKEATQLGEFNLLWAYRVVVENADMTVQVIVDTETKAVKAVYAYPKHETEKPVEPEKPDENKLLTKEEIIAIINKMPQYKKVTIIDIELDKEDGRYIYEVEGVDGKFEYDFEVDAKTGKILDVDKEKLDDDDDDEEWDD
ncbi:MAG: PepSY domain-containing protein [Cellulosilyticaceae bacterium]